MALFPDWPSGGTASDPDDARDYARLTQIPRAIWERQWATGSTNYTGAGSLARTDYWPTPNWIWETGIVSAIVDNGDGTFTITDDTKAAAVGTDDGHEWNGQVRPTGCAYQYWVGADCSADPPDMPWLPGAYDVVIQHHTTEGDDEGNEWYRDMQPWHVVRGDLAATTSKTFTANAPIQNWITAGYLADVQDLVGKPYHFLASGKLFWGSKDYTLGRYPDFPNDRELWRGSANDGKVWEDGTGYLYEETNKAIRSPYDSLTPAPNAWAGDAWADREALVYSGGTLKRLAVTGNDGQRLYFGGRTAMPTPEEEAGLTVDFSMAGDFTIVEQGARGWPERGRWDPWAFNTSLGKGVYGHDPNDALTAFTRAQIEFSYEWEEAETLVPPIFCGHPDTQRDEDPVDNDVYVIATNMCAVTDHYASPHFWKCLRHWQLAIEQLVPSFIERKTYTGAKEIVTLSLARAFHLCGINHGDAEPAAENYETVDGATTYYHRRYYFTVADAYKGVSVYHETVTDGVRRDTGQDAADASTGRVTLVDYTYASSGARSSDQAAKDAIWLGLTVYSAGWTRYHPLEFTSMYERCAFIPAVDCPEEGPCVAVHPPVAEMDDGDPPAPDCSKVGEWIWAGPSQGHKTFNVYGSVLDGAHGSDTGLVAGKMYRYTGFNWHEGRVGDTLGFFVGDDTADMMYWDRFFEGRFAKTTEATVGEQVSGTVTAVIADGSGAFGITDDSKSLWDHWYTEKNGVSVTHAGTATGGSSTTCQIGDTWTDPDHVDHCWFQTSRFLGDIFLRADGTTCPFKAFTLEVDKEEEDENGDPITVTYEMPITDVTNLGTGNEPVIHFDERLDAAGDVLTVEAGDTWRIKEPATNLNYWRSKRIRFTPPAGDAFELDVLYSTNRTIWFPRQTDAAKRPQVGWAWSIVAHTTGGVWEWRTTEPTTEEKAERDWQKVTYAYTDDEDERQEVTGYWVQPLGADPRGADWKEDSRFNEPHKSAKLYGRIVKGDIITHDYIYAEMYAMLNKLVWTKRSVDWHPPHATDPNYIAGLTETVNGQDTWANEKAWVEAGYDAFNPLDIMYTWHEDGRQSAAPFAYSVGESVDNECVQQYHGWLYRRYSLARASGITNLIASKTSFLAYATKIPDGAFANENLFDDNGDGVAEDQFVEFHTEGPSKATSRDSDPLGDATYPDWVSEPPAQTPCGNTSYKRYGGYQVTQGVAISKWNVTGGLRYVDATD